MVSNRELKRDFLELQQQVQVMMARMDAAVVVSNPDSPMAAAAYDGLRKTVVRSLQATQILQAAIAQLDSVAAATDDMDTMRAKLSELMTQVGITKLDQYDMRPDAFERIGEGPSYVVKKPAYVASADMPAIQMGVAEAADEVVPTTHSGEHAHGPQPSPDVPAEDATPNQDESTPTGDAR